MRDLMYYYSSVGQRLHAFANNFNFMLGSIFILWETLSAE